ncbi:hypothetical protein ACIRRA_01975 [Nocardia sp. NPDC101769]|uniref:hypothetical protein n=1 Tax=Nocardia sp. NPDC101769 TaxID=3364333 RepID=UPI00382024B7
MSDNPANRNRTRRRVVRQAGPPVEDDGAGIEVQETIVEAVSPEATAAEAAAPSTAADAATSEASEPKSAEGVEAKLVEGAEAKPVEDESSDPEPKIVIVPPSTGDAADESAGDADESGNAVQPSRLRRITASLGRLGTVAAVVALVSALVLIGSGGLFFYHQHRADALRDRRAEYVQVAKQAYLDMVTVKSETADQDIDRLLQVAGGNIKDEFATNRDEYKKLFEQLKVQSSGKVISAAIERDDSDSATVLLLAQQTVSNVASNGPMQKDYRFRVTVTRKGDTVAASSMELVP